MHSFLQTAYRNALLEIKRLAEIEDISPTTLIFMIETEASKTLSAAGAIGSR